MTWDDKRDGIGAVRHTDGTCGIRLPYSAGDRAVAGRLAVRNFEQRIPHLFVEFRSFRSQFEIEVASLAGVVFIDLTLHMGELLLIALRIRIEPPRALRPQVKAQEPTFIVDPSCEISEPGLDRRP